MARPQRLDFLERLRERREDDRLADLGKAREAVSASKEALTARLQLARADVRRGGDASEWLLGELAHQTALRDVERAKALVQKAENTERLARDAFSIARREAEAVRRVVGARREDARVEDARKERRELDELALLRVR